MAAMKKTEVSKNADDLFASVLQMQQGSTSDALSVAGAAEKIVERTDEPTRSPKNAYSRSFKAPDVSMPKERFGTTLAPEVKGALEIQGKRTGTNAGAVIEMLVREHLQSAIDEYHDHERMKLKYAEEYSVARRKDE